MGPEGTSLALYISTSWGDDAVSYVMKTIFELRMKLAVPSI